jgi:hypothetical protein
VLVQGVAEEGRTRRRKTRNRHDQVWMSGEESEHFCLALECGTGFSASLLEEDRVMIFSLPISTIFLPYCTRSIYEVSPSPCCEI